MGRSVSRRVSWLGAIAAAILLAGALAPVAAVAIRVPRAASVIGPMTAVALDTNGDGLYDRIVVNVTLNVTQPGQVTLSVRVVLPFGNQSQNTDFMENGTDVNATVGAYAFSVGFDTDLIGILESNGPYTVEASLYYGFGLPRAQASIMTPAWRASAFDGPAVRLSGAITDEGRDVQGDGHFDQIVVHVPFRVNRTTPVVLYGWLGSPPGFQFPPLGGWTQQTYTPGSYVHDLVFRAEPLYRLAADGPYTVQILLYRGSGNAFPDLAHAQYRTQAYSHWALARPTADYAGNVTWSLAGLNATGKADALDVQVPLRVRAEGNFSVSAVVVCACYPQPNAARTRILHLRPGTQAVDLLLSGVSLARSGAVTGVRVGTGISNTDGEPYDNNNSVAFWPAFNASAFVSRPAAALTVTPQAGSTAVYGYDVEIMDAATGYDASASMSGSAPATLSAYNGTFLVHLNANPFPAVQYTMTTTVRVTVSGNTSVDVPLPSPTGTAGDLDLSFQSWSDATLNVTEDWSAVSSLVLWTADLDGNRDGTANATEIAQALPEVQGNAVGSLLPFAEVDGSSLAPAASANAVLSGAGDLTSTAPVVTSTVTRMHAGGIDAAAAHRLNLSLPYPPRSVQERLEVALPAGAPGSLAMATRVGGAFQGFWKPANATLERTGSGSWRINLGGPPLYGFYLSIDIESPATGTLAPLVEIALGLGAAAVAVFVVVFLLWRRRKRPEDRTPPTSRGPGGSPPPPT